MASSTPSIRSCSRTSRADSGSFIRADSVISIEIRDGASLCRRSAAATWTGRLSSSCSAETFTFARGGAASPSRLSHSATWRQVSSSTSRPSEAIRPLSSASGTKVAGLIAPRSACCHRASDSTATARPDVSKIGW